MMKNECHEILAAGMNPWWRRLERQRLDDLAAACAEHSADRNAGDHAVRVIKTRIQDAWDVLLRKRGELQSLNSSFPEDLDAEERQQRLQEFIRDFSDEPAEDRDATRRWLNEETLRYRLEKQIGETIRDLVFLFNRLAALVRRRLHEQGEKSAVEFYWTNLELEPFLSPWLAFERETAVQVAALKFCRDAVRALPKENRASAFKPAVWQPIARAAKQREQPVWVQVHALECLSLCAPEQFREVVLDRLRSPHEGDDFFVRRRALLAVDSSADGADEIARLALKDTSEYVRQGLARLLFRHDIESFKQHRGDILRDASVAVRGAALGEMFAALETGVAAAEWTKALLDRLRHDESETIQRAAIDGIANTIDHWLADERFDALQNWDRELRPALGELRRSAESASLRSAAAGVAERLWCAADAQARELREEILGSLRSLAPGATERLPAAAKNAEPQLLGRVLAVIAQDDYPLDAEPDGALARLTRGERRQTALWRCLHELSHPAADKRQTKSHTSGRFYHGSLRARSERHSEAVPTAVPGEPAKNSDDGLARPWLPLPDDLICALEYAPADRPVRIYTEEGVTSLTAPRSTWQRLRAYWSLSRSFARIDRQRRREGDSSIPAHAYAQTVRDLGFELDFQSHAQADAQDNATKEEEPSHIAPYFAAAPLIGGSWADDTSDYFVNLYENSLYELAIFSGAFLAVVVARHLALNSRIMRARRKLPLVIGGTGTRGKSSLERMKAALLNAAGLGVVCKLTGTRPAMVMGSPYGQLTEVDIYRPYGKTTIWEQARVLRLAADLGADAFIAECMAVRPEYGGIIQRSWSRDDIVTVTNTYPDHENEQGPSGRDVAESLAEYTPKRGLLLHSERHFAPLLESACRDKQSACRSADRWRGEFIPREILDRFPNTEHPENLTLLLELADELGLDEDFALKESADRVIPDPGALVTYPRVSLAGRTLEFSNGFAANESMTTLSNWRQLGLHECNPVDEPKSWIATIVNNRSDRLGRSQQFAQTIPRLLNADRHYLVGDNTAAFAQLILREWSAYLRERDFCNPGAEDIPPAERFTDIARRLRIPLSRDEAETRIKALRSSTEADEAPFENTEYYRKDLAQRFDEEVSAAAEHHIQRIRDDWRAYDKIHRQLEKDPGAQTADTACAQLTEWFERSLVVVPADTHAEALTRQLIDDAPPGADIRAIGLQNIKGIGNEIVNLWEEWLAAHRAINRAAAQDTDYEPSDWRDLEELNPANFLAAAGLQSRARELAETGAPQDVIDAIEKASTRPAAENGEPHRYWWQRLCQPFIQIHNSIRARKTADQILADLGASRISPRQARRAIAGLETAD